MGSHSAPVKGAVTLKEIDPEDTGGIGDREEIAGLMEENLKELYDLHYLMYADNRRSLMVVLQGIDASGKDGLVRHLASGLNPQGLKVHSFKAPSSEELDHDYLWRIHKAAPNRGEIAIFNRSHYEEVTVVKVHPELLEKEGLPPEIAGSSSIFEQRYRQINDFERILTENGTVILKFFLHISRDEQKQRFEERRNDPRKQWKFSQQDLVERGFWDDYRKAFEEMLEKTSTEHAPWYIIPADRKWYRNHLVTGIILKRLKELAMEFPTLTKS